MKNALFLLTAALLFLAGCSGCKDTVEVSGVDFDITFKATYDGEQLEKNKDYVFGAFPLRFDRYRLYLSDITLFKENGEEVRISEVEYLDFTADNGASNLTLTPKITFKNVQEGMYDGIRLGYGVKPDLNAKQPADFPTAHPLNIETDYWPGWGSYIFMVLDGKADPDGSGTDFLSFSYHCGSDPVYTTFTYNEHIHVQQGHQGIGIEFDIRKILTNSDGSLYDVVSNPATSNNVDDFRVAKELMGHYERAVTIKQ